MGAALKAMLHSAALEISTEANDSEAISHLTNFTVEEESDVYNRLYPGWDQLFFLVTLLAIIIATIISKRKLLCLRCCNGHCALAVPVNFLELKKRQYAFMSAFALITMVLVDEIVGGSLFLPKDIVIPIYLKTLYKLLVTLIIGCSFFPLFAFIYMATLPGCIIGLIYHILYMSVIVVNEIPVPGLSLRALIKELLLRGIVLSIAGTYIFYWYLKHIFLSCKKRKTTADDCIKNERKYVKQLLLKVRPSTSKTLTLNESKIRKIVEWYRKNIYKQVPGFRYSLTILASCTTGFLVITHMAIASLYGFIKTTVDILYLLQYVKKWKELYMGNFVADLIKMITSNPTKESDDDTKQISIYDFVQSQCLIVAIGSTIGAILAYIICVVNICHILTSYRDNVLNIFKRKENKGILQIAQKRNNISLVKSAIQFGGYQIAYIVAGFLIQITTLTILSVVIGELIVIPIQFAFWRTLTKVLEFVVPIVIALILIQLTQYLMVRFLFLEDNGKTLALNNRKGFFITSYFVFFFNIFTGVFSCIKRIVIGCIIGLIFVPRLDKSLYPRMCERFDSGFAAYTCLLHLEALQSSPIVVMFVNILIKRRCPRLLNDHFDNNECVVLLYPTMERKRQLALNRWYVAYTLIRNPTVIQYRAKANLLSALEVFSEKKMINDRETNV